MIVHTILGGEMTEVTAVTLEAKKRPGPRSLFRPKDYSRRVSAALTTHGWGLLNAKLANENISVGDWIEKTLRADAGELVAERKPV